MIVRTLLILFCVMKLARKCGRSEDLHFLGDKVLAVMVDAEAIFLSVQTEYKQRISLKAPLNHSAISAVTTKNLVWENE